MELIPLSHPRSTGDLVDVTWLIVPELNWATAEGSIGIIAASLPSIRPLIRRLLSKVRGTGNSGNNRMEVTEEDMSSGSRGNKAHRLHHWARSRASQTSPEDEELGLHPGPGRSTQGSDGISAVSENPVADAPHPGNHHAGDGLAGGRTEPRGRVEVTTADFAVAH